MVYLTVSVLIQSWLSTTQEGAVLNYHCLTTSNILNISVTASLCGRNSTSFRAISHSKQINGGIAIPKNLIF